MTRTISPCDAERNDADRLAQGDVLGGDDGADGNAHCNYPLQHGCFRKAEVERFVCPLDDDELQRGAGTPEKSGNRQGNLPELVAPEQRQAVIELVDQEEGVLLELFVINPGIGT